MRHRRTKGPETDRRLLNHRATSRLSKCSRTGKYVLQGLKPPDFLAFFGTTKVVPFYETFYRTSSNH
jgi:hypothetical protein